MAIGMTLLFCAGAVSTVISINLLLVNCSQTIGSEMINALTPHAVQTLLLLNCGEEELSGWVHHINNPSRGTCFFITRERVVLTEVTLVHMPVGYGFL